MKDWDGMKWFGFVVLVVLVVLYLVIEYAWVSRDLTQVNGEVSFADLKTGDIVLFHSMPTDKFHDKLIELCSSSPYKHAGIVNGNDLIEIRARDGVITNNNLFDRLNKNIIHVRRWKGVNRDMFNEIFSGLRENKVKYDFNPMLWISALFYQLSGISLTDTLSDKFICSNLVAYCMHMAGGENIKNWHLMSPGDIARFESHGAWDDIERLVF